MAFDFKKEYRQFYLPPRRPEIVRVPQMRFAAVRGHGDPNQAGGDYQRALSMLYAVCYALKMSKMGDHRIEGYFDYVVRRLEGLWWQKGADAVDLLPQGGAFVDLDDPPAGVRRRRGILLGAG